ncbi:MAG: hypothetical protein JNM09_05675 [Blastocatellia bacterium]|nr:hypothetical protein [Blastocatellia bacterium]
MKAEAYKDSGKEAVISAEEIRHALTTIVQSKYFAHAPKKQKFLQCICEYHLQGRATNLNEYLIGCEVFDKGPNYHPSADPVVRVSAHDVRKKLEMYYQNEGRNDPIRMAIPIGTYVPVFTRVEAPPVTKLETPATTELIDTYSPPIAPLAPETFVPTVEGATPSRADSLGVAVQRTERTWKILFIALTGVLILGGIMIGWLVSQNRDLQRQIAVSGFQDENWQVIRQGIYAPFLANQSSTLVILSNPVVYRTANGADPEILSKKGINLTPEQSNLLTDISNFRLPLRANQPTQLIPAFNTYTGIGEAIGAYRLHGLLQGIGEPSILKQSRNIGADELKEHDIILLGSVYANQWAKPLSIRENFVYTDRTTIENLSPRSGELREFISSFDQRTGALLEDYALITVVPGVTMTNVVMSLSGIYSEGTQAAVEYVTDKNRLAELYQRLQEAAGGETPPQFFQAVLKVRVENSFPTQATLLHVRELKNAPQ